MDFSQSRLRDFNSIKITFLVVHGPWHVTCDITTSWADDITSPRWLLDFLVTWRVWPLPHLWWVRVSLRASGFRQWQGHMVTWSHGHVCPRTVLLFPLWNLSPLLHSSTVTLQAWPCVCVCVNERIIRIKTNRHKLNTNCFYPGYVLATLLTFRWPCV